MKTIVLPFGLCIKKRIMAATKLKNSNMAKYILLLVLLSGCYKKVEPSLDTIAIAGYHGRTWVVTGVFEYYHLVRSNGDSYDSTVRHPGDTTIHVYLATDWALEMTGDLNTILWLSTSCQWSYSKDNYALTFSSASGKNVWTNPLYDQGGPVTLPTLALSTELVEVGAISRRKRVDLYLTLLGDGKL